MSINIKSKLKEKYVIITKILNSINKSRIGEYAAQCSYYTILSFIPFVILLLTLIQYTGINQDTLFNAISRVIPSNMNEIIIKIIQEVYSKSIGTISISIIFTIWSAGKGLYALSMGFQSIYKTNEDESPNYFLLRIRAVIGTLIFIVLLIIGLIVLVFGSSLLSFLQEKCGFLNEFNIVLEVITKIIFLIVTVMVFDFIYKFMPRHRVTFKSQIYGAVFGAISLNVVSLVFAKYLDIFKNFSITYGSLTTLMLIMMWTYSCFYTVLLGAKVNRILAYKRKVGNN